MAENQSVTPPIGGDIPTINTDIIGRGTRDIEGHKVVLSIPKDEVKEGSYSTPVPKPYGD